MLSYLVPNRLPAPPPRARRNGRAPNRPGVRRTPSATVLVSKATLIALAVFTAVALIVIAPPTVLVPILVALIGGLGASVLVAKGNEWVTTRRSPRRGEHHRALLG